MLNAVDKNKVKKGLFRANEDSLTSFIFEKLNYLPRELFKSILIGSIKDNTFPSDIDFNAIKNIEYWPHWNSEGTKNKNLVEPDVFIQHEKYDFIIEAKRWDENQQWQGQWEKELKSYFNEYEEEKKEIIFIALGGIWKKETEEVEIKVKGEYIKIKIYKCKWASILENVKNFRNNIEESASFLSSSRSVQNILSDMILAFAIYGFSVADWFEKFEYREKIKQDSIDKLLQWTFAVNE